MKKLDFKKVIKNMNHQAFSKIWIIVIIIVFIAGGILAWQYFRITKEIEVTEREEIEELKIDLNLVTTKLSVIPEGIDIFTRVTFSPDGRNVAYVARKEGKAFIVLNNEEGKRYNWVRDLTFSPDSQHFAYRVVDGDKEFVVLNGKESKKYDEVWNLIFSPDNKYIAYGVRKGNELWWIVERIEEVAEEMK